MNNLFWQKMMQDPFNRRKQKPFEVAAYGWMSRHSTFDEPESRDLSRLGEYLRLFDENYHNPDTTNLDLAAITEGVRYLEQDSTGEATEGIIRYGLEPVVDYFAQKFGLGEESVPDVLRHGLVAGYFKDKDKNDIEFSVFTRIMHHYGHLNSGERLHGDPRRLIVGH